MQVPKATTYIKGSGGTGVLLNGSLEDEEKFQEIGDVGGMGGARIWLSGLYAVGIKEEEEESGEGNEGDVFVWGNLNGVLLMEPRRLELQCKNKIVEVSCGWNHTLLKSDKN